LSGEKRRKLSGVEAIATPTDPRSDEIQPAARRTPALARAARIAGAWMVAVGSVAAGIGVLYLIRGTGTLAIGPSVRGALPLEQLAGRDAQPLAALIVAWVPAGLVAGLALRGATRMGPAARAISLALLAEVLLVLAGAASDAAAINEPLKPHLIPQLGRPGVLVAVILFAAGSMFAELGPRRSASRT
jgi:hypothetical protein